MTLRAHALLGVYGHGAPKQEPRPAPLSRKRFISQGENDPMDR